MLLLQLEVGQPTHGNGPPTQHALPPRCMVLLAVVSRVRAAAAHGARGARAQRAMGGGLSRRVATFAASGSFRPDSPTLYSDADADDRSFLASKTALVTGPTSGLGAALVRSWVTLPQAQRPRRCGQKRARCCRGAECHPETLPRRRAEAASARGRRPQSAVCWPETAQARVGAAQRRDELATGLARGALAPLHCEHSSRACVACLLG